nr:POTRA domain-containing protein [Roseateles koreensis]
MGGLLAPEASRAQAFSAAAAAAAAATAFPEVPRFAILEFEIDGNTVLPVAVVEQTVTPFMGDDRQMSDVEAARDALEKRYQQAGYLTVFVDVPEQRVDGGVVRLHVTEGRVERLRVTGARYYDQGVIRERVSQMAPGQVPDFNEAARQISEITRDERQIQQLLKPGLTPGTFDVELRVADKLPMSASLEINNRHTADTDPWRASLNVRYDNLWQRDHSLSLTLTTAPREVRQSSVFVANYSAPLGGQDSVLGYAVLSDSLVAPLGAGTVIGKGATYGLRWVRTVGLADEAHSFSLGADYKDVRQRQQFGGTDLSTPVRYLPFQAGYTGNWFGTSGQTQLTTSLVFASRSLFAQQIDCPGNVGQVDQFQCSRDGADGSFAYWRGDLRGNRSVTRLLGQDSADAGSWGDLHLHLGWQLSTQPLVSGEQMAMGGADTVRGYLDAEAAGDTAWLGSLEWRSRNLLSGWAASGAAAAGAGRPRELNLLGFVEAGQARTLQPLPEQQEHVSLAGTGLGLRFRAAPNINADLDVGWPLKTTRLSPKGEPRLHVRLSAQI